MCIILSEFILCVFIELEMTRGLGTEYNFENFIEILNKKCFMKEQSEKQNIAG